MPEAEKKPAARKARKSAAKRKAAVTKKPRQPRLTYRKIIDTALTISREQSISDVTIRAVATRLNVSPMALYKHVGGKGELEYQIAFDIIQRSLRPEKIGSDVPWDKAIRQLAADLIESIRVHPTILRIFCENPLEPRLVAWYDRLYVAFEGCGIPVEEHRLYGRLIVNYLIGSVMMRLNASEDIDRSFPAQLERFWRSGMGEEFDHVSAALRADDKLSLRDYEPPFEPLMDILSARAARAEAR